MLFQRRKQLLEGVAKKPEDFFFSYLFIPIVTCTYFLSEYDRLVVILILLPVNYASGNLMFFGANKNVKFPLPTGMRLM